MASQLKGLDMEISEGFLVHFIMTSLPAQFGPFKINYNTQKEKWKMSELISMCVQEEERLKSEQPDSAHVAITGPSKGKGKGKGKGKKFGKGNVQGNKSASVTKTDKASSSGTKGSSGPRCHFCKDKGHMRKECHKFREWLEKKDSNDLDYGVKMNDINSNSIDYAPWGVVPPHVHPRATEILTVLEGVLEFLQTGDVFVFPVGLVHYQRNFGHGNVVSLSTLNSQNPGVITVANAIFGSNPSIPADLLAKAFQVDKNLVDYLQ
ncbi:hypothetical protein RJ639_022564, partial [Escallonia herrerae]